MSHGIRTLTAVCLLFALMLTGCVNHAVNETADINVTKESLEDFLSLMVGYEEAPYNNFQDMTNRISRTTVPLFSGA